MDLLLTTFEYIDKTNNRQFIYLTPEEIKTVKQQQCIRRPDGSMMKFSLVYNDFDQDKPDGNIKEF